MAAAVSEIADTSVTPTALLATVRATRAVADRAEADLLMLAVEWAHAHPDLDDDGEWEAPGPGHRDGESHDGTPDPVVTDEETTAWFGIPPVAWHAPAAFAAANSMSTGAGKALLRDALALRHRLPQVWVRVVTGGVPVWRARRIAQAVLGSPRDVVDNIDATLAAVAHKVGPVTLDRILDEAMTRLYPEQREWEQLEALDARHATLDESSINPWIEPVEITLASWTCTCAATGPISPTSTKPSATSPPRWPAPDPRSPWTYAAPWPSGSWPTPPVPTPSSPTSRPPSPAGS